MELAIVAAAVTLPGVSTVADFWRDATSGRVALEDYSPDQLDELAVPQSIRASPRFVPTGSYVDDADRIDLDAFGLTAGEASLFDPQQRLILKLGREAIVASGVDTNTLTIGVYVSTTASSYLHTRVLPNRAFDTRAVHYPSMIGNDKDFAATRLAHKLGLRGPALSVQTACSSSLVAVHEAALALQAGVIDAAVVAGASITVPQQGGYLYTDGGVLSPTGRCRPFDEAADGTVKANGGGAVVLLPLDCARREEYEVIAVLRGVAVNNDGVDKAGFTAPSVRGQAAAVSDALTRAGLPAASVGYVETHGTGTRIGDPIELRALQRAHGAPSGAKCHLGSVKANYGHLDAAAGIVGLIKAALVARTRKIPPLANFEKPNTELRLARTRFVIPTELGTLDATTAATAVSAFGMGGTNAHAILTGPPSAPVSQSAHPATVTLCAPSAATLAEFRRRLADHLELDETITPADVIATLDRRPTRGTARWSRTVSDRAELIDALRHLESRNDQTVTDNTNGGRHVWLPLAPSQETVVDLPEPSREEEEARHVEAPRSTSTAREAVRAVILERIRHHLGDDDTGTADDFFESGGESIMLVDVVADVGEHYHTRLSFDELDGLTRIHDIIEALVPQISGDDGEDSPRSAPARIIRLDTPSYRPFYLHPPAGGTNFCYVDLHRDAPEIPIHAFRADLDARSQDIEDIARRCIAHIPSGPTPVRIGGYSFGGNVAVEIALQLEARGDRVDEIVLFDSLVPRSYRGIDISDEHYSAAMAEIAANATGDRASNPIDLLARLGDQATNAGDFAKFLALWQSNHKALIRYRPAGKTNARITVFRAAEPHPQTELELLGIDEVDKNEWAEYSEQPLRIIDVPGNHYTMFTDPVHRATLAHHWRLLFADSPRMLTA